MILYHIYTAQIAGLMRWRPLVFLDTGKMDLYAVLGSRRLSISPLQSQHNGAMPV